MLLSQVGLCGPHLASDLLVGKWTLFYCLTPTCEGNIIRREAHTGMYSPAPALPSGSNAPFRIVYTSKHRAGQGLRQSVPPGKGNYFYPRVKAGINKVNF